VLHGDVNMTRLLLEHGADPSQNTNHAWSVLHTAAALRRAKATEELSRLKLEKQKRDHRDFKRQERRKAAEAKNAKNVDGAVAQTERRPRVSREEFEEAKRKRKEDKAQQAEKDVKADSDAQTNEELSEQLLRVLLEGPGAKTLNINGKDERGRTALDVALLVGNIKGGKVLAAHGGRTHKFGFPNEKGWNGTAHHHPQWTRSGAAADKMTNHGRYCWAGCVCADLHRAVFEGELRTVRDILSVLSEPAFSHIIDVNAEDMAGFTPLVLY
jgi:predicted  nucleic acid-binding Zn-ribbon protein